MSGSPNVLLKENDMLEALNYDIDLRCPLHCKLLWFFAPSSLNRKFVNGEIKVAKFKETVNNAIEFACDIAFEGIHTPTSVFTPCSEYFVELRT